MPPKSSVALRYFLSNFESMGLSIQEKRFKIDFQDGNCGGHLVFPIGEILAIFDLQVTLMILTKVQVNWPSSSGEAKYRFSSGHLGFPIGKILAFLIYQAPLCFLPSFKTIDLSVQEKKRKIDFQDGCHGRHLGFQIRTISFFLFLIYK